MMNSPTSSYYIFFLAMATKSSKSKSKVGKSTKSASKQNLKQKAKVTKSQIDKLNKDMDHIQDIHKSLAQLGQAPKKIGALDVARLKSDMEKDEQRKKANKELQRQLEVMTGMAL